MRIMGQATIIAAAVAASVATPGASMPGDVPRPRKKRLSWDTTQITDHPMIGLECRSHSGTGYLGKVVSACETYGTVYLTLEMQSGLKMTFEERSVKPV